MKALIVLLALGTGINVASASESDYLDCIDYGHPTVSAEKIKACREAAQSQQSSDEQVIPPYPVPAGEIRIDALKEIELTDELILTAYAQKTDREATVYGLGDTSAEVKCNLTASSVALSNFDLLKKEYPGGTGARLYITPKKTIKLRFKTSLQGVEEQAPTCVKGHPELCEENSTSYVYRTQIFATDRTGNSTWNINCVAPFSRPVFASDVKINGIVIK